MDRLKFYIALFASKAALLALKIFGRNATYLPGKIALTISKNFLGHLTPPKTVIAVTGTNGKTTVSNMVTSILQENGYSVTNNGYGSNVQAGIATALLADSTLTGRAKKDFAVLEVDERSSLLVYPYVKPDYLLCNNLMRDSIKRNAHTGFIRYIINKALPASTKLILNADDLICASLGGENAERVYFGLDIEKPEALQPQFVQDIVYCPKCGGPLEAAYVRYNHIGRFTCKACGHTSPVPDYLVTALDRVAETFTVAHQDRSANFHLLNDNIVNVYNLCGTVALLREVGLSDEQIALGFAQTKIVKSRYDRLEVGDLTITMQSAKGQNPIACARSFHYVAECPGEHKAVFFLTDDKGDSVGNTESTCWLYDCDYSYLNDLSISQLVFSGPRCKDQRLRALLAGVPDEKIVMWPDFHGKAQLIDTQHCKNIFILFDVYLQSEAEAVKRGLIELAKEADGDGN